MPLAIRFGDDEFIDRVELTTAQFWAKAASTPTLPATAAPGPGAFEAVYRQAAADGATGVVVVSLSGALSATMQSAEARRSIGGRRDRGARRRQPQRDPRARHDRRRVRTSRRRRRRRRRDRRARHRPGVAHQGVRRARHAREPEEGWPDRQRQGAAGHRAGDQADHRGGRRQGRAGRQATDPVQGTRLPRREGARVRGSDIEPRRAARRLLRRRRVRRRCCVRCTRDEIVVGEIGPVIGTHAGRGTIGVAFIES